MFSCYKSLISTDAICSICNKISRRHLVDQRGEYKIYKCSQCKGVYSVPMKALSPEEYEKCYTKGDEVLNNYRRLISLSPELAINRARNYKTCQLLMNFLKEISQDNIPKTLLDIGCGTGIFLYLAKEMEFEVYGIDQAKEAVHYAKERLGLTNVILGGVGSILSQWRSKFDVITCIQILEHVENPRKFISDISELLAPGGALIIAVPNYNRLKLTKQMWDCPPHHLTRWSANNLELFLRNQGFDKVVIKTTAVDPEFLWSVLIPFSFPKRCREFIKEKEYGIHKQIADLSDSTSERIPALLIKFLVNLPRNACKRIIYIISILFKPFFKKRGFDIVACAQKD